MTQLTMVNTKVRTFLHWFSEEAARWLKLSPVHLKCLPFQQQRAMHFKRKPKVQVGRLGHCSSYFD